MLLIFMIYTTFLTFELVFFILETHYLKTQQLTTNNSDYFLFSLGTDWA